MATKKTETEQSTDTPPDPMWDGHDEATNAAPEREDAPPHMEPPEEQEQAPDPIPEATTKPSAPPPVVFKPMNQLSIREVQERVNLIRHVRDTVMVNGVHYGASFPGDKKHNLLKPGAEVLAMTFQLCPEFEVVKTAIGNTGHREVDVTCTLRHILTGKVVSSGVGSCSTMEAKYRWRQGKRSCPSCGNENSIIKGKAEFGGGWICFAKKGGCGAKFADGDQSIEGQNVAQVENPDIADVWNTVLKQAKKRAFVDAVLTPTGASELFTQDVEDMQQAPAFATQAAPEPVDILALIPDAKRVVAVRYLRSLGWLTSDDLTTLHASHKDRIAKNPGGFLREAERFDGEGAA